MTGKVSTKLKGMGMIVLLLVLWSVNLGQVPLLDWDEANFAEISREMLMTGEWSYVRVGFEPFWEKPPLFFWLQALSFKCFGINEWAARFPNIIVAFFTFLLLLSVGEKRSPVFSRAWVMMFALSFLPQFYFKTGLIDPLFNLLTFSALLLWLQHEQTKEYRALGVAILLLACAILTKGPTALLILGLCVVVKWVFDGKKSWSWRKPLSLAALTLISLVPYVIWMGHQGSLNQNQVAQDFMSYLIRLLATADAGHRGFPLYHVIVLALGCLPASLYLYSGWKTQDRLSLVMKIILLSVVIVFSLVQTKIIHYSSLAYFPLTYLAALGFEKKWSHRQEFSLSVKIAWVLFVGMIFSIPVILSTEAISSWIRDPDLIESVRSSQLINPIKSMVSLMILGMALFITIYCFISQKLKNNAWVISLMILITHYSWVTLVVPEMASVTQGSLIGYYKRAATEKVNIQALGFKSYAAYYYSQYDPARGPAVYAVSRARDQDWAMKHHALRVVERSGGWVLYRLLR